MSASPCAPLERPQMPLLAGARYELGEVLGRGGMATVMRGWDHWMRRPVAVKIVRIGGMAEQSEGGPSLSPSALWRREAEILAGVRHTNIVSLLDVFTDDESGYLVLELLPGGTLKQHVQRYGPLSVPHALDIALRVCHALRVLHRAGFVHRDIKPHNLLFSATGEIKLADFGVAERSAPATSAWRRRPVTTPSDSSTLMLYGTATYAAPEQLREELVTPAADLYSLGIVLYELLAGQPPFTGSSLLALAMQHAYAPVPDVREFRPEVPAMVAHVLRRALQKQPARRYHSASAMAAALRTAKLIRGPRGTFRPSAPHLGSAPTGVEPAKVPAAPPVPTLRLVRPLASATPGSFGSQDTRRCQPPLTPLSQPSSLTPEVPVAPPWTRDQYADYPTLHLAPMSELGPVR